MKIFSIADGNITLDSIKKKLKSPIKSISIEYSPDGDEVELGTRIQEHEKLEECTLFKMAYQYLDKYTDFDGRITSVTKTNSVKFTFIQAKSTYLIMFGKNANRMAEKMSKIVFAKIENPIRSCQIRSSDMDEFLKKNSHEMIRCNWSGLRYPTITKAMLNGRGIEDSKLFKEFDDNGQKHGIFVTLHTLDATLTMNQESSLHFYKPSSIDEQIRLTRDHILPICR